MSLLPIRRFDRMLGPRLTNFLSDWFDDDWFGGMRFPAIDVKELDNAYIVKADLPGFTKDNIEVELSDGVLTIKAQNETSEEVEREGYLRKERRSGSVYRSLALPEEVDQDKIKADFKDGVLSIELPRTGRPRGRRITIH